MGIQINGNTNNINAGIGSLSIEDINELDIVGVATAANFKTGVSNLHNVGLTLSGGQIDVGSNIKIGTAGVVTATSFVGSGANLTGVTALSGSTNNTVCTVTGANAIQGESNLTFDGSTLSVTGAGAFTGNIDLNSDTNKLKIGAGDDFQFFHNGSNNFIETNNGDIRIKTSDGSGNLTFTAGGNTESFRITSTGMVLIGETSVAGGSQKLVVGNGGAENFEFTPATSAQNGGVLEYIHRGDGSTRPDLSMYVGNGAFKVYTGGNNERLRIDSTGITTITSSSNEEIFRIQTSFGNGGSAQGKALMGFDHFSVSQKPAILIGSEEEGTSSHKGSFVIKLKDAAATDDDPVERLRITSGGNIGAGGITSPLWTSGGGIHLNDNYGIGFGNGGSGRPDFQLMVTDGSKLEFRCGFGADTADIVMDTSGRLLIGTTTQTISSSELFEVKSTGGGFSHFRNNSSSYATIYIDNEYSDTGFAPFLTFTDGGGNRGGIGQDQNDLLRITGQGGVSIYTAGTHGGGTEKFKIDQSGRITKPSTPAFLAYHHANDLNYGVGDTLAYMHTVYNTGNHYNTSNYTFTAPIAGRYLFSANANGNYTSGASGIPRAYWKINGSNVGNAIHLRGSDATHDGLEQRSQTVIFNLAANDTVKIVVGQNQWDLFGANSFMGYLIG